MKYVRTSQLWFLVEINYPELRVCLFCHLLLIVGLWWRISNTVQSISGWAPDARTPTKSLWAGAAKPGDCAGPELGLRSGPALTSHQNPGTPPDGASGGGPEPSTTAKCPMLTDPCWCRSSLIWNWASCLHVKYVCGCLPDSGLRWKSLETPALEQKSWHLLRGY